MKRAELRPGAGWKCLGGSVWAHTSGARVHLLGVVRLPDGSHISASTFPEYFEASRLIRINGGNRKRGLMAWAANIAEVYCGRTARFVVRKDGQNE